MASGKDAKPPAGGAKLIFSRLELPLNASSPILVIPEPNSTDSSAVQFANEPFPILVTVFPILAVSSDVAPLNTLSPIVVS